MIQRAAAMGNLWLATSSQHHTWPCIMSSAEFSGKTSNHPAGSTLPQPTFGALWLLASPKTKITFEREEISDHRWDSRKHDGDWENCVRSHVPTLKGTEESLSCVQCFLYLVSSSKNVSSFHSTWLDTFWTDSYFSSLRRIKWGR